MSKKVRKTTPTRRSAQACIDWLKTPEGKKKFAETMRRAEEFSEELTKSCECDPKDLLKPMTI